MPIKIYDFFRRIKTMAAKIFYQEDCNLSLLEGKKIAIIVTEVRDMLMLNP